MLFVAGFITAMVLDLAIVLLLRRKFIRALELIS